ncbi:hypothetical protein Droror1_Dr00005435, partial [Drosera rotundifolia]
HWLDIAMADDEISRMHKVRRTLMEMLNDRGYDVAEFEINMTKQQFIQKYGENMKREDLVILKARINNPEEQIYVFFPDGDKVGVKTVKDCANRMKSENISRAILVTKRNLTPFAKSCLSDIQSKFYIETFMESELLINVTKHDLVPTHQLLSDEEKKTLLERYTVKEIQLPRMQQTDAVARYYGLKRGQVVKIIRPSETAGQYVTYRYVI